MNKAKSFMLLLATTMIISLYSNAAVMAESELAGTGTQTGTTSPDYYPSSFQRKGVISSIETGKHKIIIDGRQYSHRIDLQVHSPSQKYGSAYNLKVGQTLGFSYTEDKDGNRTITEIWIIDPRDYEGT